MTKYDKVSYPDDQHFVVNSGDGDEYHATGNGIYNVYTVGMDGKYRDTFKIGCFRFEKTRKTFLILATLGLVLFIVLLAIIITATKSATSASPPEVVTAPGELQNPKQYGLFAYPERNGVLNITYKLEFTDYKDYYDGLVHAYHAYSPVHQYEDPDYIDCDNTTTDIPKGKACRFPPEQFGVECSEMNLFGYNDGQPCIMLQLRLKPGLIPEPYTDNSALLVHGLKPEQLDPNHVSVTCQGKTDTDKSNMGTSNEFGPPINFKPNTGFPIVYYKFVEGSKYIPPAVMVKFNQLLTHKEVFVTCSVWAKNLQEEKDATIPLYTRTIYFKVY